MSDVRCSRWLQWPSAQQRPRLWPLEKPVANKPAAKEPKTVRPKAATFQPICEVEF